MIAAACKDRRAVVWRIGVSEHTKERRGDTDESCVDSRRESEDGRWRS